MPGMAAGAPAPGQSPGGGLPPQIAAMAAAAAQQQGQAMPSQAAPSQQFRDLRADLPPHYQLLDLAERTIRQAIETGGFYKTPTTLAAVTEIDRDLQQLIAAFVRGSRAIEAPATEPNVMGGEPEETSEDEQSEDSDVE
jgi:hypothetical protein